MKFTAIHRLSLAGLKKGVGIAAAPLVWLALATFLRHGTEVREVHPANTTLATMTGLDERSVERGLALLAADDRIVISYENDRGHRFHRGRVVRMILPGEGLNPLVMWPPPEFIRALWAAVGRVRASPTALAALAVAAYCVAADELGERPAVARTLGCSQERLRDMVGQGRGGTWTKRLAELERAGVLRRAGRQWRHGLTVVGNLADIASTRARVFADRHDSLADQAVRWFGPGQTLDRPQTTPTQPQETNMPTEPKTGPQTRSGIEAAIIKLLLKPGRDCGVGLNIGPSFVSSARERVEAGVIDLDDVDKICDEHARRKALADPGLMRWNALFYDTVLPHTLRSYLNREVAPKARANRRVAEAALPGVADRWARERAAAPPERPLTDEEIAQFDEDIEAFNHPTVPLREQRGNR